MTKPCVIVQTILLLPFFSELLDEQEFGKASEAVTFDENLTNSAEELGLTVSSMTSNFQKTSNLRLQYNS